MVTTFKWTLIPQDWSSRNFESLKTEGANVNYAPIESFPLNSAGLGSALGHPGMSVATEISPHVWDVT